LALELQPDMAQWLGWSVEWKPP